MCLRYTISLLLFLFRLFNFFVLLTLPFLGLYYEDYLPIIYLFPYSKWNKNVISYKTPVVNASWSNTKNFSSRLYVRKYSKINYKVYKNNYNWNTWFSLNHYSCINISVLKRELKSFFKYYENNFKDFPYFAIIFKIKFADGEIRSCSTVQVSKLEEFEDILSVFSYVFTLENFADRVSEHDNNSFDEEGFPMGNIIFGFKPMINYKGTKYEKFYHPSSDFNKIFEEGKDIKPFVFKGYKIPATMNLYEWPNIIFSDDYKNANCSFTIKDKSGNSRLSIVF